MCDGGRVRLRRAVCMLKEETRAIACQCEHTHLEKSANVADWL